MMPQWPWLVYSQRQRSVITRISEPNLFLISLTAFCTIPFSSISSATHLILPLGYAEKQHSRNGKALHLLYLFKKPVDGELVDIGHGWNRNALFRHLFDKQGVDQVLSG